MLSIKRNHCIFRQLLKIIFVLHLKMCLLYKEFAPKKVNGSTQQEKDLLTNGRPIFRRGKTISKVICPFTQGPEKALSDCMNLGLLLLGVFLHLQCVCGCVCYRLSLFNKYPGHSISYKIECVCGCVCVSVCVCYWLSLFNKYPGHSIFFKIECAPKKT